MGYLQHFKKYPGGGFYLAAGLFLLATKPPELITVVAAVSCAALAVLSVTRYTYWAAIGGGMLIAVSLFLQSVLSYRCVDCIRADLIILAGVITLSFINRGRYRRTLIILASAVTVFTLFNTAVHYNPLIVFGVVTPAEEARVSFCKEPQTDMLDVIGSDGREQTLDVGTRPVLMFSPGCGACIRAVEYLAGIDPEGRRWAPVQSYGDPGEGRQLLLEKGYLGQSYVYLSGWHGPVPAMITAGKIINDPGEMLDKVRGGSD